MNVRHGFFEGAGDDVAVFVDVAQAVRFVQHRQVPMDALDVVRFAFRKLVGADDDVFLVEGVGLAFAQGVVVFVFEDDGAQAEFVLQFLVPLFAQVGGDDDEDFVPPLCPALRDDQPGFDGFARPTSSARMTPRESGLRQAKSAASTWCGLRSTWASTRVAARDSMLSLAARRVSCQARYWLCCGVGWCMGVFLKLRLCAL